jgi:hypothetical protein
LGGTALEALQFADQLLEHTHGLFAFASSVLSLTPAVLGIWTVCAHRRARNRVSSSSILKRKAGTVVTRES